MAYIRRSEKKFVVDKYIFFMYYSLCREYDTQCASGSAVEHHLAKVGVAGSIPVSRSGEGSLVTVSDGGWGLFFRVGYKPCKTEKQASDGCSHTYEACFSVL